MIKDYRILALLGAITVGLLAVALLKTQRNEYAQYQRQYQELTKVKDSIRIFQTNVNLPEGMLIVRCETCHQGVNNPEAATFIGPLKTHPSVVKGAKKDPHDVSKIGCVVCHEGNGRGLTVADGHGRLKHWGNPLLTGKFIQSSCSKCHIVDTNADLASAPVLNKGKRLFISKACWACHTIDGVSAGKKGPNLTSVGEKFTVEYIRESITDPTANILSSTMPKFDWTQDDPDAVDAMVVFLKAQRTRRIRSAKKAPIGYRPPLFTYTPPKTASAQAGRQIFHAQSLGGITRGGCVNCHTYKDNDGNTNPEGGKIAPELTYTIRSRGSKYVRQHIKNPTKDIVDSIMPKFDILTQTEMDSLILFMADMKYVPRTKDPVALYENYCASCHGTGLDGTDGKGRIAKKLLDPMARNLSRYQFVATYRSRFKNSLRDGIPGTAMPPWKAILTDPEIDGIINFVDKESQGDSKRKYTRIEARLPATGERDRRSSEAKPVMIIAPEADRGKKVFGKFCTSCHGKLANGKGPVAYNLKYPLPRNLRNRQYMKQSIMTDVRLYRSILLGVPGTPMLSHDHLTDQQVLDTITYLRTLTADKDESKEAKE